MYENNSWKKQKKMSSWKQQVFKVMSDQQVFPQYPVGSWKHEFLEKQQSITPLKFPASCFNLS